MSPYIWPRETNAWRGWRSGWSYVIINATAKDRGPQHTCVFDCQHNEYTHRRGISAYSRNRLHTENERVRREISGIRKGVFLPQLPEKILFAWHIGMMKGEVAYISISPLCTHIHSLQAYLRRRDVLCRLTPPSISHPIIHYGSASHSLKTNHNIVAFSLEGKAGLCLRTKAKVTLRMTAQPDAKIPSSVVTDHLLARYPTMFASMG